MIGQEQQMRLLEAEARAQSQSLGCLGQGLAGAVALPCFDTGKPYLLYDTAKEGSEKTILIRRPNKYEGTVSGRWSSDKLSKSNRPRYNFKLDGEWKGYYSLREELQQETDEWLKL
jgi:hypothetical protein